MAREPSSTPVAPPPDERFRIVIRPIMGPEDGLDITETLIRAVAAELSRHHSGNDVLNWLEAEALLESAWAARSLVP